MTAGHPRNTYRWRKIRARWFDNGEANSTPCADPDCRYPGQAIRYDLTGSHHPPDGRGKI